MPRIHRVNFDSLKKCSDDPAQRLRTPGCSVREKTFEPHSRTSSKTVNVVTPDNTLSTVATQDEPAVSSDKFIRDNFTSKFNFSAPNENGNKSVKVNHTLNETRESSLSHVKFNYIDEDTRKLHENYIKRFKEHHNTTPEDIMAAEMSQSTYIKDQDIMHDYINRVSKISEQGYTLHPDPKTHNEYMKTFLNKETGDVAVAYRGTQTWIGQDGRANVANTVQLTKFRQMMSDHANVDLRTKKAKILQETNEYIKSNYGDKVSLTTGHSQGSHDSTQAKRNFFNEAKSVVFQPAPGGEVRLDEGKMFTTPNDIVSMQGKLKAKLTMGQMYKMNYTQSTDTSVLNRLTGGHMLDNQAAAVPSAVGESASTVKTLENAKITAAKNIGRGITTGFAPAIIADLLVENVASDQNEHAKTAEKAVLTAGGESAVSSMVAGTSAGFVEAVVPVYASFEAASVTHDITSNLMKEDTTTPEAVKEGISGAYSGAAGGATFAGTRAAQTAIVNVARSALASTAETAGAAAAETAGVEMATMGGVEMAAMGGAELTGLAAAEAGLLTATEVTGALAASEAGLNPVLDAAFIATALGAGIGGLIGLASGLVSGNHNEQELNDRRDAATEVYLREEEEGQNEWAAYYQRSTEEAAVKNARSEMGRKKFGQKPADGTVGNTLYDPYVVTSNAREISRNTNLESEDSVELLQSDEMEMEMEMEM